jgi:alpha-L-fucosidase 2
MEWSEEFEENEKGHRHLSHLYGVFPADVITEKDTDLWNAAKNSLEFRLAHGGGHTGWSCAWITNMWARLYDGNMVYENIKKLITHSTYPNLLNKQPHFRIDGNLGGTAAITEALMQCTNGNITLLPALPDEWSDGCIRGIKAKGGFEINISWEKNKLKTAEITSLNGSECRIRTNCTASVICGENTVNSRIEDGVIIFDTVADEVYTIIT